MFFLSLILGCLKIIICLHAGDLQIKHAWFAINRRYLFRFAVTGLFLYTILNINNGHQFKRKTFPAQQLGC